MSFQSELLKGHFVDDAAGADANAADKIYV